MRPSILLLAATIPAVLAAAVPQSFSTRLPNRNPQDSARLLAADPSGNVFIIYSSPRTSAVVNIHVIKADPAGNFIAAFDFGGTGIDTPNAATVDPQGNLIVAGATRSADFPLVSPLLTTGAAFLTKIDAQLQRILFSTRLGSVGGGPLSDGASAVAADAAGNIYVAGSTSGGFPATVGVLQQSAPVLTQTGTIEHGFVTEIAAAGDRVVFSTYFSGASFICATSGEVPCTVFEPPANINPPVIATTPSAIAVDSSGGITIAGTTNSSGIPVGANAYAAQCGCDNLHSVAFIARMGAGGTRLEWGTYFPLTKASALYAGSILGVPLDTITSLALDASGNVVFAGTAAADFPISTGALQPVFPSASAYVYAGYVAKLDTTGTKLLFSTWLGGATSPDASTGPAALALDDSGTIWVTGGAAIASLPASSGAPALGENYIAGLSANGSSLISLFTVPDGSAGQAIQITSADTVNALGTSGALLISSGSPTPSLLGFAASPSYTAANAIAPRELFTLYGTGIGPSRGESAQIQDGVIASSIAGVQVLFDDVPAPLLYAGPGQINAIVPAAMAGREHATISVVTPTGTIAGPDVPVKPTLPQVFANLYGVAAAENQDGTLNSASNPATSGSIVAIWVTGGGAQDYTPDNRINTALRGNPWPVSILATDPRIPFPAPTSLEVLYAGDAPGQPSGVIQVNFVLPAWFSGDIYQIQIGAAAATFTIYVG
jgi:uncharacterized protein (TIGR03437 family)